MHTQSAGGAGGGGHGRTASYGTTLLDTLNEEKQRSVVSVSAANHQRHYSLMADIGGGAAAGQQPQPQLSVSPPTTSSGGGRLATAAHHHVRSHTLTTSPPGTLLRQPMPINSLLSSSALRSSYSSSSLRASFGSRNSPSPLGAVIGGDPKITPGDPKVTASFDEGVWGPSGLSNELDILATPVQEFASLGIASGGETTGGAAAAAYARLRSYSFNSPPEGSDGPDDPDIDVLHAAAKSQNPSLAFRKLMARTNHARSKTLASPFASDVTSHRRQTVGHSRQPSASDPQAAADAAPHIGIGGESNRTFNPAINPNHHVRQASADFDFAADGVPTRSLWVGN
ncbi:hypothetical protein IWW38_005101, partial [Coemansia aciculifera]